MKPTTLALLLIGISFAPSLVRADDTAPANSTPPAATAHKKGGHHEDVEARITELHTKLKITAAQEDLWKPVSQEMRDRAKAMHELMETREHSAKTMSALDDLKSYADITEAHADGMKKFIDVFTPLYDAMSDDQKKNADEIFRAHKEAKKKA